MTWLLMWFNERVATLNATSQLLILYRFEDVYCIVCSYARPIRVKGKDKTLLHNKHGERSYSSENQHFGFHGLQA